MNDIQFDITTREVVMTADMDFVLTSNPSVQNGGILLYSRGANPLLPMAGVGLIPEIIDGNPKDLTFELNRWKQQAVNDGATLARWSAVPGPSNSDVLTDISYE